MRETREFIDNDLRLHATDKLSRGAASATLLAVRKELGEAGSAQLFSSENKQGIDEARAVVTSWLRD